MTTHTTKIYRKRDEDGRETEVIKERVDGNNEGGQVVYREDASLPRSNPASRVIYYLLDVLLVLLALRLVFLLLGANAGNAFVSFIYNITQPLVAPFIGIFPATLAGGTFIEWATVLAMVIYSLIFYAIARLIQNSTRSQYQA